jgi:hypothetical protein
MDETAAAFFRRIFYEELEKLKKEGIIYRRARYRDQSKDNFDLTGSP